MDKETLNRKNLTEMNKEDIKDYILTLEANVNQYSNINSYDLNQNIADTVYLSVKKTAEYYFLSEIFPQLIPSRN